MIRYTCINTRGKLRTRVTYEGEVPPGAAEVALLTGEVPTLSPQCYDSLPGDECCVTKYTQGSPHTCWALSSFHTHAVKCGDWLVTAVVIRIPHPDENDREVLKGPLMNTVWSILTTRSCRAKFQAKTKFFAFSHETIVYITSIITLPIIKKVTIGYF